MRSKTKVALCTTLAVGALLTLGTVLSMQVEDGTGARHRAFKVEEEQAARHRAFKIEDAQATRVFEPEIAARHRAFREGDG